MRRGTHDDASSADPVLRNGLPVCGAQRSGRSSSGPGVCLNFAGYGTDHKGFGRCKFHGGSTPNHMAHAVAEAVTARVGAYGEPVVVDPMAALIGEVHRTAGHIAWLSVELQHHPDPATFETRVLLKHYQQEREHLVRVSKAAIDSGVAEREVRLAEDQGRLLTEIIYSVIRSLALSPRQSIDARRIVAQELRRVGQLEAINAG